MSAAALSQTPKSSPKLAPPSAAAVSAFTAYEKTRNESGGMKMVKKQKKKLIKKPSTLEEESQVKKEMQIMQKALKGQLKATDLSSVTSTNGHVAATSSPDKRKRQAKPLQKEPAHLPHGQSSPKGKKRKSDKTDKPVVKKRRDSNKVSNGDEVPMAKPLTKLVEGNLGSDSESEAGEDDRDDNAALELNGEKLLDNLRSRSEERKILKGEEKAKGGAAKSGKKQVTGAVGRALDKGSVEIGKQYLEWMIHPVAAEQFLADSWEKRPVHIKRGQKGYYKDIFSTKAFDSILRDKHVIFGKNLDVTSYEGGKRETHNPPGRAYPPVVWDFYNNGCSLRMLNPQTFWEPVWKSCATLQEFFGTMVGANVYLTPPGTQGFAPHYDDVEVFILQLEGRKHWRLYEPRTKQEKLPRFSSPNFSEDEIGEPCKDLILEAGDLLYFPRGTIHQANCLEDVHSLHITISCQQMNTFGDLLEKIVPAALAVAMEESVEFRQGLPVNYLGYMGVANADSSSMAKERAAFLKKLEKLVGKLFSFSGVDAACDQMGKRFMHDMLPPCLDARELTRTVEGDGERWNPSKGRVVNRVEIAPDTELRLIRLNVLRLVAEEDAVRVYFSAENSREFHGSEEQFLELEAELAPAVEAFVTAYPKYLRAEDLPAGDGVGLDEKMKLVQELWERKLVMTLDPLEAHYDD